MTVRPAPVSWTELAALGLRHAGMPLGGFANRAPFPSRNRQAADRRARPSYGERTIPAFEMPK